ncbi:hypothetical protein [Parablautia muri]|uniref:Uncharacterized protein n=1 Tax=Parablautia muri TaxID=2320879 RepID=A0A9X5BC55_9FIRM|nr:hypothetical protein [Parablautia muri]NBJ91010.1 hypothetical protein [Parablautia muri]
MRNQEILAMGRKPETIYTTQKKNQEKERRSAFRIHHNNRFLEELIKKFFGNDMRRCYVYINGISMPVSHA